MDGLGPFPMDDADRVDLPPAVRVDARLRLAVTRSEHGRTSIIDRHEAGAFRFRMPRRTPDALEAMLVNVAGGLAGGDRIDIALEARENARLVLSSATAERIYRSGGQPTRIAARLRVEQGGVLAWLPNETILHDGARFERELEITVEEGGRLLFGEVMQLGRLAAGESFTRGSLRDSWRVRIGGRLAFAEALRLEGEALGQRTRPALLGNAGFVASLLLVGPDAGESIAALRAALGPHPQVRAAATTQPGLVFARLISDNDIALRVAFLAAVRTLSGTDIPLPRLLLTG